MLRIRRLARSRSGFTLIEILIVTAIIATLLTIAIPNFLQARENSRARNCMSNLRAIDGAKQHYAMDHNLPANAVITEADLVGTYLKGTAMPQCPSGGTYSVNRLDVNPTCTVPGHVMN